MGLKFTDKKTGKIKFYWEDGKDAPFTIEDDTEDDTEDETENEIDDIYKLQSIKKIDFLVI